MERIGAVVLAAGSGKRMGADIPKQYLALCGKPVMVYCLEAFEKSRVDEIVLVVAPGDRAYCRKEIVEKYHITKVSAIVDGGAERYDSVYQGLLACTDTDYVFIHDGARPFVTQQMISECFELAKKGHPSIVAVPVKDTMKRVVNGVVVETPNRDEMYSVQTPQAAPTELLKKAHEAAKKTHFLGTDEASLIEKYTDIPVCVVKGAYTNIKLTTPEDLLMAEQLLVAE